MRIVLGVSGGVAAYKAVLLLRLLREQGHRVRVVPTASALRFVGAPTWEALSGEPATDQVFEDVEHVPHVALGQGADLVVVAPATADLLARAAAGRADDLLTSTLLTARCPVVMAPAMHTEMWEHPATAANVATLRARGVHVIEPASGRLTGADTGPGRLPEPDEIARVALAVVEDASR
ncbi:MAG: flavoprotein, partial [Cellulosimicrobium funkei]